MIQARPLYRLVLHPTGIGTHSPDLQALQDSLLRLGLLGERFRQADEVRFRLGEHFFQYLTFMGCAPVLKLEPEVAGDERFCHFRMFELPRRVFRYLRPEARGRCPRCRKPAVTAAEIPPPDDPASATWQCPRCREAALPAAINWKHEAGMGKFFIELLDVHPHEVVPTDSLLQVLADFSGQPWQYFYADS